VADGRRCVFCELRPADSGEHLTPDWLRQALPRERKTLLSRGSHGREVVQEVTPFDVREHCVCTPCNNHWMSTIDNRVKPHLLPLVLGEGRELDPDAQLTLATWAFKTCLVYQQTSKDLTNPYDVMPREHYRFLYQQRKHPRPPGRMQTWLLGYLGKRYRLGSFYSAEFTNDGSLPTGTKAYQATLVVGCAVIHVFATYGYDENLAPLDLTRWGDWSQVMLPMWPVTGGVSYPASHALDDTGLVNFVRSWSGGKLNPAKIGL